MTAWQMYVLGYMVAFALGPLFLRTMLLWRATGRNPLLLESFQTAYGFVQRLVTLCLVGYGTTMGLYAFAPGLYARLPAFESLHHDWARWAGVVLTLGALVVMWLAQSAMGRSWRFGPDRAAAPPLVTGGIFGVCRNPIYLAMMFAALGGFLLVPDAVTFALLVLAVATLNVLVRLEEDFLRGVHGDGYRAYTARVGRFLPGLGRLG